MQHRTYPLPPLFLTEVIDKARTDHEGATDLLDVPVILSIKEGYGRHKHDGDCRPNCTFDCDDSDWIVQLEYSRVGWCAVYGVRRSGDVQDVQLWMD